MGSWRFFIFLLSLKYSNKLLLGEKTKQDVVVWPVGVFASADKFLLERHSLTPNGSLSCDTHGLGAGSTSMKGMLREQQTSSW